MATSPESVFINHPEPTSNNETTFIAFNVGSQLPLKLTSFNFPLQYAQLTSLLIGYDLQGYIDSIIVYPSSTFSPSTSSDGSTSVNVYNPVFQVWLKQDKLILHVILASVFESIMPFIVVSSTAHNVWSKLQRLYTNHSCTRVMQLKKNLTLIQRESYLVSEYLYAIKVIVGELIMIDFSISADDITLYALNGFGSNFDDIAVLI